MTVGIGVVAFIVVVAALTLVTAVSMAWRPGERALVVFRHLSAATVLASLSGMAAGLAIALNRAADAGAAWGPDTTSQLLAGLAESMVPPLLGFSVLAVAWLVVALGLRRQL